MNAADPEVHGRTDPAMTRTMAGMIQFWNDDAEDLYGWTREEAVGRVSHDLLRTQFPMQLSEIESQLVRAGRWEGRLVHTTRDGGRVVVQSRWLLDLDRHPGAVVEINRRWAEPDPLGASWRARDVAATIATVLLASASLVCALVALHALSRWFWIGDRGPTSLLGVITYLVLPAGLAGVLLACLRLSPVVRIRLAMVLFSAGLSTYLLETAMTLWQSLPSVAARRHMGERANIARESGIQFDRRTPLEMVAGLRKDGVDAHPAVPGATLLKVHAAAGGPLPLTGISRKLTVLCNESGQYVLYESDEHGFHNPLGLWNRRVAIAAVGDSYVQGQCVPPPRNFAALIRERHAATLNLGAGGQGPLRTLATIREYLPVVRPSVVLWFYYEGNDLLDLRAELRVPLLRRYLSADFQQDLVRRQEEIDHAIAAYVDAELERGPVSRSFAELGDQVRVPGRWWETATSSAKLSYVRRALGLVSGQRSIGTEPTQRMGDYTDEVREWFPQVMTQARAAVREWGGQLYFVYLPEWSTDFDIDRDDQDEVMNVVRNLDVPVIDVRRPFRQHDDPASLFPFRMVGHYNEAGHRVVATEVLANLHLEVIRP